MTKILVVEDEPGIALGLEDDLRLEGYDVEVVSDGIAACRRASEGAFDLMLLDVMLPGKDGFEVCREVRRAGVKKPIIMLTAQGARGGEDPGARPRGRRLRHQTFQPEGAARPDPRGASRAARSREAADVYRFGDIEVDRGRGELRRGGASVDITSTEFKLLSAFVRHRGRVLSRDQLLNEAWGPGTFLSDRVVDNHIVSLRRKIETDPGDPAYLVSVRGLGYRFDG